MATTSKDSGHRIDRLRPPFTSVLLNLLVIIVPIVIMILIDFALIVERFSYQRQLAELQDRQRRASYSHVHLLAESVQTLDRVRSELVLASIVGDPYFSGAQVNLKNGFPLATVGASVSGGAPELLFKQDILVRSEEGKAIRVGELILLATPAKIYENLYDQRRQLMALAVIMLLTITGAVYIAYRIVVGRPLEQLVEAIRGRENSAASAPVQPQEVKCGGRDEITELFTDFNKAEAARSEYHWQLVEAKLTLEEKVRERTEALSHALTQANSANESKASFLANMSHELRTPLNAIIGFAEVIQHTHQGDPNLANTHEHSIIIADSGRHLLGLLNTVLDYSKTQSGKMKLEETEFHLVEVVESATRTFSQAMKDKGITMTVDAQSGLPDVKGDMRKITQILLNVLSNAVKFTDADGTVAVKVTGDAQGMSVAITDSGTGLTPEELELVMEPFEQAKNASTVSSSGTGLGLPLSKEFAEMHDGTLKIDSVKGEGTTLTLWLPASRYLGEIPGGQIAAA